MSGRITELGKVLIENGLPPRILLDLAAQENCPGLTRELLACAWGWEHTPASDSRCGVCRSDLDDATDRVCDACGDDPARVFARHLAGVAVGELSIRRMQYDMDQRTIRRRDAS